MQGLMMNTPLTITAIMQFAEKVSPECEIVSVTGDNTLHRYTYREAFRRVRQLANALQALGVGPGDRVATLAWNDYRHFELYYAISGSGAVCHTVNPRLFAEQVDYIINHAENQWVFIDVEFVSLLEKLQDKLPGVAGFVVLTDEARMPETSLRNVHCYESLIADQPDRFDWPELDENAASALCYTSGTTGDPKGALYSHRSTVLNCFGSALPDSLGLSVRDVVMPIVPMFHINGWGLVYSCVMVGAKLVMPGPKMGDGEALASLINAEGVTLSAGVPTVWLALLDYLDKSGQTVASLDRVAVGGAACPLSIMERLRENYGVKVMHGWGMTEMSAIGTLNSLKPAMANLPKAELDKVRVKQGRPLFGVDMKITDDDNNELPWDGLAFGALKVRGPWVIREYYRAETSALDADGWFDTGDVATIDTDGYLQITDRSKDVIKSGGEWISSIELENCAMAHPGVAEAAVIGVPHPKWSERPLLLVVEQAGASLSKAEMLAWFKGRVAKWCIPQDCVLVKELPHTATGKVSKKTLREQFRDYQF